MWPPSGPQALERFLAAYRAHRAGLDHELLLVWRDFGGEVPRAYLDLLDGVAHRARRPTGVQQDLGVYRRMAEVERRDADTPFVFLNSQAEPLVDDWLRLLCDPLAEPTVGVVGATGSWESHASAALSHWRRSGSRSKLRATPALVSALTQFPRFPNPHVRTNAFAMRRGEFLSLRFTEPRTKRMAHRLESGWLGLSRQLRRRGMRVLVVDRAGETFRPHEWPRSATFRADEQARLVVGDNRTREYRDATPERRRELETLAWGAPASG